MAHQSWWGRLVGAVEREYERRVRRASGVLDYTANQRNKDYSPTEQMVSQATQPTLEALEEEAAIVNVPRGTRLARPNMPLSTADQAPAGKDS